MADSVYPPLVPTNEPAANSYWRHHSGRIYKVLFLANKGGRASYPRSVVYQGANGEYWVGALSDWNRRMVLINDLSEEDRF
jgi:hypothetical protein